MPDPAELYQAILTGNAKKAEEITKAALEAKVDPRELVQKYMIPAMDEVGRRMQAEEYERARKAKKKQGEMAMLGSFLGTAASLGKLAG